MIFPNTKNFHYVPYVIAFWSQFISNMIAKRQNEVTHDAIQFAMRRLQNQDIEDQRPPFSIYINSLNKVAVIAVLIKLFFFSQLSVMTKL